MVKFSLLFWVQFSPTLHEFRPEILQICSHLIDLQYSHLSRDDPTLRRNCFKPLTWTDHRCTCHSMMKRTGLDNEGICYWYSIIPSRLKCYGEISWSVSRLSFSLITAWPLPSLYGYLKWENITSMTGYKDTRLWYHDKEIVSQSIFQLNWLTQSVCQVSEN